MFNEDVLVTVPRAKTNELKRLRAVINRAAHGPVDLSVRHPDDWSPDLIVKQDDRELSITCWETSRGWTYFVADDHNHRIISDEKTLVRMVVKRK